MWISVEFYPKTSLERVEKLGIEEVGKDWRCLI